MLGQQIKRFFTVDIGVECQHLKSLFLFSVYYKNAKKKMTSFRVFYFFIYVYRILRIIKECVAVEVHLMECGTCLWLCLYGVLEF